MHESDSKAERLSLAVEKTRIVALAVEADSNHPVQTSSALTLALRCYSSMLRLP